MRAEQQQDRQKRIFKGVREGWFKKVSTLPFAFLSDLEVCNLPRTPALHGHLALNKPKQLINEVQATGRFSYWWISVQAEVANLCQAYQRAEFFCRVCISVIGSAKLIFDICSGTERQGSLPHKSRGIYGFSKLYYSVVQTPSSQVSSLVPFTAEPFWCQIFFCCTCIQN